MPSRRLSQSTVNLSEFGLPWTANFDEPRGDRRDGAWNPYRVGTVKLAADALIAGQDRVKRQDIANYVRSYAQRKGRGVKSIIVIEQRDGRLVVFDGHHRLAAQLLLGKTRIPAILYTLA